jgi:iron complex transport system permease protein
MNQWLVLRPGGLPLSFRLDRRVPLVVLVLALATVAVMVVTIGTGEYPIPPLEVVRTLLGAGGSEQAFVVTGLRLPRALAAVLVGMALALAGAILQGVMRNPLASPDVVGVSAGAGLAAVATLVLLPEVPSAVLPLAAFGGALAAMALTALLAWRGGSAPLRLLLVGIGVAAVAQALTTLIITFGEIYRVNQAAIWMTGSVYGRSWEHVWPALPWLLLGAPLAWGLARHLDVLHYGEEIARGLGSPVERQRRLLLGIAVGLSGMAVATAGPVGFVGLMAPHLARRLVGPAHAGLLPVAALAGGLLVVLADLLGRTLFAPIEIPCGVITAAIGAPYFLVLLYRGRYA